MQKKIAVYKTFNPLAGSIIEMLESNKHWKGVLIEDERNDPQNGLDLAEYDLFISMAYHKENEILTQEGLGLFLQYSEIYTEMSFVFLSWFHPFQHIEFYDPWFNIDNGGYKIMNTDRCRILELPVQWSDLEKTIIDLLKLENKV